ncbi:MAG: DNRLRE domain-containing protein [Saprospiraceae bacterium]
MKKPILFFLITFCFTVCTIAQVTLELQPGASDGKDSEVFSRQATSNYVSNILRAEAWTFQGSPGVLRSFFQFDLSSIPAGATIDSAYLYLYSPNAPTTEIHSGSNAAFLRRVTGDWQQSTITWNNQPSSSDVNQVLLPVSTAQFQDYGHINVRNLVTDMVHNPNSSFGFVFFQEVETPLRRMSFCSSDYPDDTKHPKLVVHYTPPSCTSLILRQDGSGQDNQVFSQQPTSNYVSNLLRSMSWTFQGSPGIMRSLLQFDMSTIPANSEIVYAYLSLYAPDEPTTEFHSGSNSAYLQRITHSWNESTVTWNNQPSSTSLHQVTLPSSTSDYQEYLNINVTALVDDMLADPNSGFGFLIRQVTEDDLRRLSFVSGDYPNVQKHPKLEVCYNAASSVHDQDHHKSAIKFYPNPSTGIVHVQFDTDVKEARLQMIDMFGRNISTQRIYDSEQIDISELMPSIYVFRILSDQNEVLSLTKFVKQ